MPCRSDYLQPTAREKESVKILELLCEVDLYSGPIELYGDVNKIGEHTAMLCAFCQNHDVKDYSLELQIWWRDHLEADRRRLEGEMQAEKTEKAKKAALDKLTPYERELLGIQHD